MKQILSFRQLSENSRSGGLRWSVSSASFYYWYRKLPDTIELQKSLARHLRARGAIDGMELAVNGVELDSWCRMLKKGALTLPGALISSSASLARQVLNLSANSLHLEPLSCLPEGAEKKLAQHLDTILKFTGISDFTVHPDDFELRRWKKLMALMPEGARLSVENMDPDKSGYQELSELGRLLRLFPSLSCTLDICHWRELGYDFDSPELHRFCEEFRSRISKVHFSVPRSASSYYGPGSGISTMHHLWAGSGEFVPRHFFDLLHPGTIVVIEGVIPSRNFQSFETELALIQDAAGAAFSSPQAALPR